MIINIGITGLNEENNIGKLLRTVTEQTNDAFKISKIYFISDGSTDNTVSVVKSLSFDNIVVIDEAERLGKSRRLEQIFSISKSDILILLDADTILESDEALSALVQPIIDGHATLTSGRTCGIRTAGTLDKIMEVSEFLQNFIKTNLNGGINIYACHGRIIAIHKDIYKNIKIPISPTGNDAYLYITNKEIGRGFEYVPGAISLFKMPQNVKDYVRQRTRFNESSLKNKKSHSGSVKQDYAIPISLRLNGMILAFAKFHLYTLLYISLIIFSSLFKSSTKNSWEVSESTKAL